MSDDPEMSRETPLSAFSVLNAARKAVPAVKFALGAAGIAVAGAIVMAFLGNGRASFIIFGAMIVAMLLLFVFARLVSAKSTWAVKATGTVLIWAVTIFFCTFLLFTVTAVAAGWPSTWVRMLGLPEPTPAQSGANQDEALGARITEALTSGYYDRALADAIAYVKVAPDSPDAHNLLGSVWHKKGHLDAAIQSYDTALQLNPQYAAASANKASTLIKMGLPHDAKRILEDLLRKEPINNMRRLSLALANLMLEEYVVAGREFEVIHRAKDNIRGEAALGLGIVGILGAPATSTEVVKSITYFRQAIKCKAKLKDLFFGANVDDPVQGYDPFLAVLNKVRQKGIQRYQEFLEELRTVTNYSEWISCNA